jgi:hypothetical protein
MSRRSSYAQTFAALDMEFSLHQPRAARAAMHPPQPRMQITRGCYGASIRLSGRQAGDRWSCPILRDWHSWRRRHLCVAAPASKSAPHDHRVLRVRQFVAFAFQAEIVANLPATHSGASAGRPRHDASRRAGRTLPARFPWRRGLGIRHNAPPPRCRRGARHRRSGGRPV